MTIDSAQLAALAQLVPGARVVPDGAISYIFLPKLRISTANGEKEFDGLLCPEPHGGYSTRLFLSAPVEKRGQNWSTHQIAGRAWHTWSWNHVPAGLQLPQMLSAHLSGLR